MPSMDIQQVSRSRLVMGKSSKGKLCFLEILLLCFAFSPKTKAKPKKKKKVYVRYKQI